MILLVLHQHNRGIKAIVITAVSRQFKSGLIRYRDSKNFLPQQPRPLSSSSRCDAMRWFMVGRYKRDCYNISSVS